MRRKKGRLTRWEEGEGHARGSEAPYLLTGPPLALPQVLCGGLH